MAAVLVAAAVALCLPAAAPAECYQVLYSFTGGSDGASPRGSLIQATDGNFYGTTFSGGGSNYGTIFKMDSSGILTTLHSFSGSDGAGPEREDMPQKGPIRQGLVGRRTTLT